MRSGSDAGIAFDRLAAIDGRRYRALAALVVLGYVLALLWQAAGYTPAARLFPLAVGVPLVGLLLIELATTLAGRGGWDGPFDAVFDRLDDRLDGGSAERYRRTAVALGWLAALLAAVWLLGHLLGALGYVIAAVRAGGGSRRRALLAGVAAAGGLFVLFELVLSARLYGGLLGVTGGLP